MSSDGQPDPPITGEIEAYVPVHSLALPVAEFEGEMVRLMIGVLPAQRMPMDYGYRRGTRLKLEFDVEVIKIAVDEARGRNKGDLQREHTLAVREARIVGVYTAEELEEGVGGSLAAGPGELDEVGEPAGHEMDDHSEGEDDGAGSEDGKPEGKPDEWVDF